MSVFDRFAPSAIPMSRNTSETWGIPFLLRYPFHETQTLFGVTVITKISVSLIFTGPSSLDKYQR